MHSEIGPWSRAYRVWIKRLKSPFYSADALLLALPQSRMSRLVLSNVHPVLGPASGGTEILIEV